MPRHVRLELHGDLATVARVTSRLHALGAQADEVHLAQQEMCIHLCRSSDYRRVVSVLSRLADVTVNGVRVEKQCPSAARVYIPC